MRDARAHAAAAEHADACGSVIFSLPFQELGHAPMLLGALEQLGLRLELDGGVLRRAARASTRLVSWVARGSLAAIRSAIACAAASSSSAGCSAETSPIASASSASMMRPVSSSSAARASPTISFRRQVAPAAAMMPSPVSGLPNFAAGVAMRMSAA